MDAILLQRVLYVIYFTFHFTDQHLSIISGVVPGAPTILNATAGNAEILLHFAPPTDNGGLEIIEYLAESFETHNIAGENDPPNYVTLNFTVGIFRVDSMCSLFLYVFFIAECTACCHANGRGVSLQLWDHWHCGDRAFIAKTFQ